MSENESSPVAILIDPVLQMGLAYRRFLREFVEAGEEGMMLHMPDETEPPDQAIRTLHEEAAGVNLPEGWVPCSTYWLLSSDDRLLGEIRIRHRLTPSLEDFGGHIGYMVRPGDRGKGNATRMVAAVLDKARALGLTRVMLSCDPENKASARVIQKNGGKLASESLSKRGTVVCRYWIDL